MRSTEKIILFAKVKQGAVTRQWPVAVFNTAPLARSHVGLLKLAYSAGNAEMVRSLDARSWHGEDGKTGPLPAYSIVRVPYNPVPGSDDDDALADETPETV